MGTPVDHTARRDAGARPRVARVVAGALALSSLLGAAAATTAPTAVAHVTPVPPAYVESLVPPEWLDYASTPSEWTRVIDTATRAIPNWYEGVAVLNPGQTIEVRAKLVFRDMPPLGSTLRTTLVRVADLEGGTGPWAPVDLAAPEYSEHVREMWTEYRVPDGTGGGFVLALTADPLDGGPGYFIAMVPLVVLPPHTDPADVPAEIVPGPALTALPAPPPADPGPGEPAPEPPAPPQAPPVDDAPPPPADASAPPAPAASEPERSGAGAPAPAAAGVRDAAAEHPAWLLPAAGVAVALAIAAAVARRTVAALQRRASIRRLAERP
ncbi:hypothetical protein [Microbacterium album]|uniref:hypothetical protein n=1 Tax=Microbacterium album TaxID=2053191 RepID=UPI001669B848|nr:hypothetical protein [Microbacterium album]